MLRLLARLIFWLLFDLGSRDEEEIQEDETRLACRFILSCGNHRAARLAVEKVAADPAFTYVQKAGGATKAMALITELEETMYGAGLAIDQAAQEAEGKHPETSLDARLRAFFPAASRPFANGNGLTEPPQSGFWNG